VKPDPKRVAARHTAAGFHVTDEGERFWGSEAAGVLCIAEGSGRLLLTHRSFAVEQPGTWGLPGGALERGETPAQAAKSELREETAYSGQIRLVPAYVFRSGNFRFHNFIGHVPAEFRPRLNWENQGFGWFDLDDLPSPLHFGVKALLQNSRSLIER